MPTHHLSAVVTNPAAAVALMLFQHAAVHSTLASAEQQHHSQQEHCHDHPWPYEFNTLLPGDELKGGGDGAAMKTARASLTIDSDTGALHLRRLKRASSATTKAEDTKHIVHADEKIIWSQKKQEGGNHKGVNFALVFTENGLSFVYKSDSSSTIVWETPTLPAKAGIAVLEDRCKLTIYEKAPTTNELWSSSGACYDFHIISHSHNDPGWLMNPDAYFHLGYGGGPPRFNGGVKQMLTSMVKSLTENPHRTFTQCETYFFERWWRDQTEETRTKVKRLVKNKQLYFAGGGWVEHDEANVHQESAISNMGEGLRWLHDVFGDVGIELNIAWNLDQFGHSSASARMMTERGVDAVFWQRNDAHLMEHMLKTKTVERIWQNSPTLGPRQSIFVSPLNQDYNGGCNPDFEFWCGGGVGVIGRGDFEKMVRNWVQHQIKKTAYRHGMVFVMHGGDFANAACDKGQDLIDKAIKYINEREDEFGVTAFYSSPQRYVRAVRDRDYAWPVQTYDYFPNYDDTKGGKYWTGYFASHAAFKGFERYSMNQLTTTEIAQATITSHRSPGAAEPTIKHVDDLRRGVGLMQHHDTITGTSIISVMNWQKWAGAQALKSSDVAVPSILGFKDDQHFSACHLANISACAATEQLTLGKEVKVHIFNPLAQAHKGMLLTVPIPISGVYVKEVASDKQQVSPTWELTTSSDGITGLPHGERQYEFQIHIEVDLPPLTLITLTLEPNSNKAAPLASETADVADTGTLIENEFLKVLFTPKGVTSVCQKKKKNIGGGGDKPSCMQLSHAVGGYVFKGEGPAGLYVTNVDAGGLTKYPVRKTTIVSGPLCTEVRQTILPSIQVAWRLCSSFTDHVEVLTGISPDHISSGRGFEYMSVFESSDVDSDDIWYTDSQALEVERRKRCSRDWEDYNFQCVDAHLLNSNIYPIAAFAYINSTSRRSTAAAHSNNHTAYGVVTDRGQGVVSMKSGELQFLTHRFQKSGTDDLGVSQPLKDSERSVSSFRLVFNAGGGDDTTSSDDDSIHQNAAFQKMLRTNAQRHTHLPLVRFSTNSGDVSPAALSPATASNMEKISPNHHLDDFLPPAVQLHTMALLKPGEMLLRLFHMYAAGEQEASESGGVTVDIKRLLQLSCNKNEFTVTETEGSGIYPVRDLKRVDFKTCSKKNHHQQQQQQQIMSTIETNPFRDGTSARVESTDTVVTIHPMEIRTFIVRFSPSCGGGVGVGGNGNGNGNNPGHHQQQDPDLQKQNQHHDDGKENEAEKEEEKDKRDDRHGKKNLQELIKNNKQQQARLHKRADGGVVRSGGDGVKVTKTHGRDLVHDEVEGGLSDNGPFTYSLYLFIAVIFVFAVVYKLNSSNRSGGRPGPGSPTAAGSSKFRKDRRMLFPLLAVIMIIGGAIIVLSVLLIFLKMNFLEKEFR